MRNLIWYLVGGTRGGMTRGRIISLLKDRPSNMNRIAKELSLDYKTVLHHVRILEKNNIIEAIEKGKYGAVYFLTDIMKHHNSDFLEIWGRFGKQ